MPTTTLTVARDQFIDEVEGLAWKVTLASVDNAASTVTTTDPRVTRYAASNALNGRGIFIPSAAAVNQFRTINTMTVASGTATLTTYGPTYSAAQSSVSAYILPNGMTQDYLTNLLNDALEYEFTEYTAPLGDTQWTDHDMAASGVTNWTDAGGATSSKITTAANVYSGLRSLRVLNSGANGYTQGASIRVTTLQPYLFWAIVRNAVGTSRLRLVDGSSNTIDTVDTTESRWQFVWLRGTLGSAVESVAARLMGVGATDDSYWDSAAFVSTQDRLLFLPSWADERFKIKAISRSIFYAGETATGVQDAMSRELVALDEGKDYRLIVAQGEVNPYAVEILTPGLLHYPLWITGRRPYSDLGTYSAETDTSLCPLHVLLARSKYLLGSRLDAFRDQKSKGLNEIKERERARVTERPRRPYWGGPWGGRKSY